jgi:hypothetical protein
LTTNATAPNGGSWANLDAFEAAKSVAEQHNATVDTFACAPATALALSTLKEYGTAGSNVPLLQSDPSAPASRTISGVPLLVSPAVAVDVVWALPRAHHHGAAVGVNLFPQWLSGPSLRFPTVARGSSILRQSRISLKHKGHNDARA